MKVLFFILCLHLAIAANSQEKLFCDGIPVVSVRCWLMNKEKVVKDEINSEDLKDDLVLILIDSTYKIKGFRLVIGCRSKYLFSDAMIIDIFSNRLSASKKKVKLIPGDLIGIQCINVEKNGKLYKLETFFDFEVY